MCKRINKMFKFKSFGIAFEVILIKVLENSFDSTYKNRSNKIDTLGAMKIGE